ncbi:MAG: FkbM family methyltransferase [Microscillaceae bacterium]|nr:FkbM family methyltransferase [Microscillaceae bacterium]
MAYYSKKMLARKCLLLAFHGFKNRKLGFGRTLGFCRRYLWQSLRHPAKVPIGIRTEDGLVWLRTHTSDLEVFFQHYVYGELWTEAHRRPENIQYILDCGANIGLATLVLARLYPEARLAAVELEAENFALLQKNCARLLDNGRLKTWQGAFYHKAQAHLQIQPGQLGEWNFSTLEEEETSIAPNAPAIITLETITEAWNGQPPDLIKMDIEGGETGFLQNDEWCNQVLPSMVWAVELHGFAAHSAYFYQLRRHQLSAYRMGEYWVSSPSSFTTSQ